MHVGLAAEAQLALLRGGVLVERVADEHAEARLEGRHLGGGLVAPDVVNGDSSLDVEAKVANLGLFQGGVEGL